MTQLGFGLLSYLLALSASFTGSLERAFWAQDARLLGEILAPGAVSLSLPDPISFSDQVSREQAVFLFRKIFRDFETTDFYPAPAEIRAGSDGRYIYKARWTIRDRARDRQAAFWLFFDVRPRPRPARPRDLWAVTDIKAEKL